MRNHPGTVTENGVSNNHTDGSAIFIGDADLPAPNITKAVSGIVGTGGTNIALGAMFLLLKFPSLALWSCWVRA